MSTDHLSPEDQARLVAISALLQIGQADLQALIVAASGYLRNPDNEHWRAELGFALSYVQVGVPGSPVHSRKHVAEMKAQLRLMLGQLTDMFPDGRDAAQDEMRRHLSGESEYPAL